MYSYGFLCILFNKIESINNHKSLRGYQWMQSKNDLQNFTAYDTRIKYIRQGYEFENNQCQEDQIEDGGVLMAGGTYVNGKFTELDDKSKWTHLKLDSNISKKTGNQTKHYNYYIKISNYHLFYQTLFSDSLEVILTSFQR